MLRRKLELMWTRLVRLIRIPAPLLPVRSSRKGTKRKPRRPGRKKSAKPVAMAVTRTVVIWILTSQTIALTTRVSTARMTIRRRTTRMLTMI